jgi:Flp pilus assembly protein protease CpaA
LDVLWLQIVRFIPLLILFGYAAFMDHKQGWVSNRVWLYTPVGFALLLVELWFTPHVASYALAVAVFCVVFGFGLFYLGGLGGADCKALMMLGLCYPLTPGMLALPLFALVLGALLVGVKFIVQGGKGGLKGKVRFLPYFFVGLMVALI